MKFTERFSFALPFLAAALAATAHASVNGTPHDTNGVLIQGTDCVLFQSENGNLYSSLDSFTGFNVGDTVHIVGEEGPCVSACTYVGGCFYGIESIELVIVDPTLSFCFGDGTGGLPNVPPPVCPCGNAGDPGAGCANSTGLGGKLMGLGTPSATSDDLEFFASQLPPNRPSLLFGGVGAQLPGALFGDGLRCVTGSVQRLGVRFADSQGAASWTGGGLIAQGGWQAGDSPSFQVWYRDAGGPCGTAFNVSGGSVLTLAP